jgi:hypothetical protein
VEKLESIVYQRLLARTRGVTPYIKVVGVIGRNFQSDPLNVYA